MHQWPKMKISNYSNHLNKKEQPKTTLKTLMISRRRRKRKEKRKRIKAGQEINPK
jgi:hypothetical protein